MSYNDVYVLPVPRSRLAEYRKLAELGSQVWRDHGALHYVELVAEDVKPGRWTSFPQSVQLEDDEIVIVSFVTYRDRAHRDEVNAKVFTDPRFAGMDMKSLPFDGKRMFSGGFSPFVGEPLPAAAPPPAVQPYLFFRGRCEEAIGYYREKLGAEVIMMMRFKDNPDKPDAGKVPTELDDRIMHASMRICGSDIMLSDGMRTGPLDFQCMSLSLSVPTAGEAERLFEALAADGAVQMPMGKTFFAERFGAVTDKFGVSWMIGVFAPQ
jgi:PhnB protein